VGWTLALLAGAMAMLSMGNGSVFQLVPQRFAGSVGIMIGIAGAAGGFGGFLVPSVFGFLRDRAGTLALGFAPFSGVALLAVAVLAMLRRSWRVQWNPDLARRAGLLAGAEEPLAFPGSVRQAEG
jgi:MFS transporter, NNP family, nitrate/nitrite transporter